MKKYRVNVNGTDYDVSIELIDEKDISASEKKATVKEETVNKAPSVSTASSGGEKVDSPMPGTILAVNVKDGDSVKSGEVLFVLEAMKMENEILAPADGTVASVSVSKGASVETGALLCVIK